MRTLLSSMLWMFWYDVASILVAMFLRQFMLDRDLVLVLWYDVQRRLNGGD